MANDHQVFVRDDLDLLTDVLLRNGVAATTEADHAEAIHLTQFATS